MIKFSVKGDWKKTFQYLEKDHEKDIRSVLEQYGERGVAALSSATPIRSGKTASSWTYKIQEGNGNVSIEWHNSNINKGCNIAILIQYGHGTRSGAYVEGIDYINPAIKPIFDEIAEAVWKEVSR